MRSKLWEIPVEDHLYKFALKEYLGGMQPPYPVKESTAFGKMIFFLLTDRRKQEFYYNERPQIKLPLMLSDTLAKRSPDIHKLSKINRLLDYFFKSSLIAWVNAQSRCGVNQYLATQNFFAYYSIEEGVLFNRYYRYIGASKKRSYNRSKSKTDETKEKKAFV